MLLALWMRQAPKLLFLDDPAHGVDVGTKAEIRLLIKDAAAPPKRLLVLSALEQALFTRRRTSFAFTTAGLLRHSDDGSLSLDPPMGWV